MTLRGVCMPLPSVRSAAPIFAAGSTADACWLRDYVVIIAASHADGRDFYQTPMNLMPGTLVIANEPLLLVAHGTLRAPGLWETLLVAGLLIALMS